jgi:hypothetical protein
MDDPACDDVDREALTLDADGSVRIALLGAGIGGIGSKAKWASGAMHRADGSPVPSGD